MKFAALLFLFLFSNLQHAFSQACNSVQSLSVQQEQGLQNLMPFIENALFVEDLNQIDSLNLVLKNVLGSQAGIPEAQEYYTDLGSNSSWLNTTEALNLAHLLIDSDSLVYVDLWKLGKGMYPPSYQEHSIFLRSSAEIALGLLKIAQKETNLTKKNAYNSWAIQALDSLATMQLPNGAFPFPDLRTYNDPVFSSIIQNFMLQCGADSVNVLQNGWIIDDKNTGEFKFDAGIICNAFAQAYFITGLDRYKTIALAVGNYLNPLKLNSNYNYNSFVALGLFRAFQLSNDITYKNRALENLRLGVSPGQTENGRWADGHNAKSVYHSIILQNSTDLIGNLESTHDFFGNLDSMFVQAVSNQVNYTNTCHAATGFKWALISFPYLSGTLEDSLSDLIGKHIQKAASEGNFLDVSTMGEYFSLLSFVNSITEKEKLSIEIFPNPNEGTFFVNCHEAIEEISILDSQMSEINLVSNHLDEFKTEIDLNNQASGIYFIRLKTKSGRIKVQKIIVSK